MEHLLDELEENVTCQDLYKIHTGYRLDGYSDESDLSSESEISRFDFMEPPPYTYEEISQNLATGQRSNTCSTSSSSEEMKLLPATTTQENVSTKNKQPVSIAGQVAFKLSQLITEYCYICHQPGPHHYRQTGHYKNVIKWLETQLEKISQPVNIKLFFCQACNLSLSGNDEAQSHYLEETHQEKAKSFCVSCQRVVDAINMPSHCKSKKHLIKIQSSSSNGTKSLTKSSFVSKKNTIPSRTIKNVYLQENKEIQMANSRDVPRKSVVSNSRSYATVLKSLDSTTQVQSVQLKTAKITKKITKSVVLKQTGTATKNPVCATEQSISLLINPLALMLIDRVQRTYCHLCQEPVKTEKGNHYWKKQHYKVLRDWIEQNGKFFGYDMSNIGSVICFSCHFIFPTFDFAQQHYRSKEHEKFSKYYCNVCMVHENSEIHNSHKKGPDIEKETSDQLESNQVNLLIKKDKATRVENKKEEQISIKHTKDISTNDVDLGTKLKGIHFKQTSTEHGRANGSCNINGALDVKEQIDELDTLNSSNSKVLGPELNAEHESGKFIKEKLKDMLSPFYCQICQLRSFDNHYITKEHIRNLRNWLDLMILNAGVKLDRQWFFCEDCDLILSGAKKSLDHYKTKEHFLGTSHEVSLHHHSEEHYRNLHTLHSLNNPTIGNVPITTVNEEMVESVKNVESVPKKIENKEAQITTESKNSMVKAGITKPNLEVTRNYDRENEKQTIFSNNKTSSILNLGLKLSNYAPKQIISKDKEHFELCKNIRSEYLRLVTRLETLPLTESSAYLKKFNNDISGLHKKYSNAPAKSNIKRANTITNTANQNRNNIQPNGTTESKVTVNKESPSVSSNLEMVKLKNILTKFINKKFHISALNEIRRLIMVVGNFRKALEVMKLGEADFKIENVFQFSDKHFPSGIPYLMENQDALEYEVYKITLVREIEQLSTFVNNQRSLNRIVIVDCLSQLCSKLEKQHERIINYEVDRLIDYFGIKFNKISVKNEITMRPNTKNQANSRTDLDNVGKDTSVIKSDECGHKKKSDFRCSDSNYLNLKCTDCEVEKGDMWFDDAVECSCKNGVHKEINRRQLANEINNDKSIIKDLSSGCVIS